MGSDRGEAGEVGGGGGSIGERCKQHYKYVFFCLLQFVSGFFVLETS